MLPVFAHRGGIGAQGGICGGDAWGLGQVEGTDGRDSPRHVFIRKLRHGTPRDSLWRTLCCLHRAAQCCPGDVTYSSVNKNVAGG